MTLDPKHATMLLAIADEGFKVSDQLKPDELELYFDTVVGGKATRLGRLPPGQKDCFGDFTIEMDSQCVLPDGLPCSVKSRCKAISALQQKAMKLEAKKKK